MTEMSFHHHLFLLLVIIYLLLHSQVSGQQCCSCGSVVGGVMAAFFNLVRLVTGYGESNKSTDSPGQPYTKWVFVDEEEREAEQIKEKLPEPTSKRIPHEKGVECTSSSSESKATSNNAGAKKTKNQKKKEKKKSRNRSNSTTSGDSRINRSVSWGNVEEVLFSRELGLGSVPSSGLFPLGFGAEEDRVKIPVDLHVSSSQVKLIERAQNIGINMNSKNDGEYNSLETRQFDYRRGKNPLFHSLTEDERITLLGSCARPRGRSRSSSLGSDETIHTVNDSNKELIEIRRSRQSSTGCSCKAVKVEKLSVTKLKQELINHKEKVNKTVEEIQALSKAELIASVRDVLQSCPMCVSNSCSCVAEGIGCHIEVCSCFKNNRQACENEYNDKSYSSRVVDEHRSKYLTSAPSCKRSMTV